eukprot:6744517-Prymnesium_polylepis.1
MHSIVLTRCTRALFFAVSRQRAPVSLMHPSMPLSFFASHGSVHGRATKDGGRREGSMKAEGRQREGGEEARG